MVQPLEGFLECLSTGNLLLVKGEFKTRLVLECSRCSEPFETDYSFEMSDEFPVIGTPSCYGTDDYARVNCEDEPYPLFQENSLMVEALLHQGLWANMPMRPLCESCQQEDSPKTQKLISSWTHDDDEHPFEKLSELKTDLS